MSIKKSDVMRAMNRGEPVKAEIHPALLMYASSMLDEGMNRQAYALAKAAEALNPEHPELQAILAGLEGDFGRRDIALKHALKSLELKPRGWWHPLHQVAMLDPTRKGLRAALDDGLANVSEAGDYEISARQSLWHAIARVEEANGNVEAAFDAYTESGRLRVAMESISPAREDVFYLGESNPWEAHLAELGPPQEGPTWVFIVGMPRTGSTLVEQVLTAGDPEHTLLLGEDDGLYNIANRAGEYGPKRMRQAGEAYTQWAVDSLAQDQARGWRTHVDADRVTHIVNKSPGNYAMIGLMRLIWGDRVKVIHTYRDPRATLVSCWRQNFGAAGLNWSCDWPAAVERYKFYQRFMGTEAKDFADGIWSDLEIPVLHVKYADLVSSWDGSVERIWDFVYGGDAPLDAYEPWLATAGQVVKTASNMQVRQPVNTAAIDRWRRYEARLPAEVLELVS